MTITAFNLAIDRFLEEDIPEQVEQLTRVLAAQALSGVVLMSPVDTGRARGGWLVSVDARRMEDPERYDKAGSAAISDGMSVIGGVKAYQNVIVQNNVEYIEFLEEGTSTQAPQGMLAVTVAQIEASLG